MKKHITHIPNNNSGFTLIEVLVAIVVLSIGLLGLAGLQVAGMKNNYNAYQRSQATNLAYDIADRMRANMEGVGDGSYDIDDLASLPSSGVSSCTTTSGCSTSQMASNDLYEWKQELATRLPNGQGLVCIDSTPNDGDTTSPACDGTGDLYTVKIWWQERGNTGTSTPAVKRFTTSFRP